MPGEEVTVVQLCGECAAEVGTFTVKKDNLMLSSRELVWCPTCGADRPQVRDIAGRRAAVQREIGTYPRNHPAQYERRPG